MLLTNSLGQGAILDYGSFEKLLDVNGIGKLSGIIVGSMKEKHQVGK